MTEGCKDCGAESRPQMKVCDVCRLIDQDQSDKLCGWCEFCQAWICIPDQTNWVRRGIAFAKNRFAK